MRTETDKETDQAHQEFMAGPKPPPPGKSYFRIEYCSNISGRSLLWSLNRGMFSNKSHTTRFNTKWTLQSQKQANKCNYCTADLLLSHE